MKILNTRFFLVICIDCTVYLCDFHRLQAWQRWVGTGSHGVLGVKDEVMSRLKLVAKSPTTDAFDKSIKELKNSNVWMTSAALREWFEKKWLPEKKAFH